MAKLELDQPAPDFTLPADDGSAFTLSGLRGQRVLLVFYPGDETPVCTAQLCEYRDAFEDFRNLNCAVVGISADDRASHQRFKQRRELPFPLLSDVDLQVAARYGAKGLMGMKRACFLLDEAGILRWQHVEATALFRRRREELIEAIKDLDSPDGRTP